MSQFRVVAQALGDNAASLSDLDKADRLRNFVHQYIAEKDLSVGFATAGEVARLQAESRIASGSRRTISRALAQQVLLGELTLEEALRN